MTKGISTTFQSLKMNIINWIAYAICNLLRLTYRISYLNPELKQQASQLHPQRAYILALWHEHLMASICGHVRQGIMPMVSMSKDGDYITYILKRLGFHTARGSSSRGGAQARKTMEEAIAKGISLALTVDGPRGPRHIVKSGAIDLARKTGAPVLPVIGYADRYWEFSSWDRFKLPKPFAKIIIVYGNPIKIDPATTGVAFGKAKQQAKTALTRLDQQAIDYFSLRESTSKG